MDGPANNKNACRAVSTCIFGIKKATKMLDYAIQANPAFFNSVLQRHCIIYKLPLIKNRLGIPFTNGAAIGIDFEFILHALIDDTSFIL